MRRVFVSVLLVVTLLGWATPYDDGKDAFVRQDWRSAALSLGKFLADNSESPDAPTASFLRGVALYQAADYRASLDAFQKLERTWPQSVYTPRLPYWKGTAALAAGQAALAERELAAQARITGQEPFSTRALLNLALARISLGKDDLAIEALDSFTRASKEPALMAQAWAAWGDLDRKSGRHAQALARYREARGANPGDLWDLWSRTQALDLLIALGRFAEAREDLDRAVELFPTEKDRWDARRIPVARGLKDSTGLAVALETVWSRESDLRMKQELASNRARVAEESGKPEALWWLRASQGPETLVGGPAILRYAYLLETTGNPSEAARALESWAATNNGSPAAGLEETRSRAAQDWLVAAEMVRAGQALDRLIFDFPQSTRMPAWLLDRGRVRLEAGDTTKALIDFTRLLKDFPKAGEGPEARYQTGLVYLKRQEPVRAEAWFYGLIEDLGSGDLYERTLLARGISFVNAGKTDLARGSLQRLIRESPDGFWTGDAWAALGRNALQVSLFEEAAEAFGQAETSLSDPEAKAKALWSQAEALAARPDTVEAASKAFSRFAVDYPAPPRAGEARYRQGAVFVPTQDWESALNVWSTVVGWVTGDPLARTREGMATALLRLGKPEEGWKQLEILESVLPSPEAWYRWGLAASSLAEADWAVKAFQYLLQHHPESPVAEAALPRAAGALLNGGRSDEALARYADYFKKFGLQPSSAPVARAAAAGATSVNDKVQAENMLTGALGRLFAVAEAYPDLKANTNFLGLQSELSDVENKLAAARRFFNSAVAEFNAARLSFPTVLLAGTFGFNARALFDLGEQRAALDVAPEVKF